MKRILIASALLVAVNAAGLLPPLEPYRPAVAGLSALLALYILAHAAIQARAGREPAGAATAEEEKQLKAPETAGAGVQRDERIDAEIVHFLGILQKKGRFLDFVMDDITGYNNEQVGAAARVVHEGCTTVIKDHFTIVPVHGGGEGDTITLESGYNPAEYSPVGKPADGAKLKGQVVHRGWKATAVNLPRLTDSAPKTGDGFVITPAEVEVK